MHCRPRTRGNGTLMQGATVPQPRGPNNRLPPCRQPLIVAPPSTSQADFQMWARKMEEAVTVQVAQSQHGGQGSFPMFRSAVKAKSPRSAMGPDAVSREDLLRLPDDLVADILSLYQQAETSGHRPCSPMSAPHCRSSTYLQA